MGEVGLHPRQRAAPLLAAEGRHLADFLEEAALELSSGVASLRKEGAVPGTCAAALPCPAWPGGGRRGVQGPPTQEAQPQWLQCQPPRPPLALPL